MKVSLSGKITEDKEYQYNNIGYVIYGAIYQKQLDIRAIFHLHTPAIVAVTSIKRGIATYKSMSVTFL